MAVPEQVVGERGVAVPILLLGDAVGPVHLGVVVTQHIAGKSRCGHTQVLSAEHRRQIAEVGVELRESRRDRVHQELGLGNLRALGSRVDRHEQSPEKKHDDRNDHEQLGERECAGSGVVMEVRHASQSNHFLVVLDTDSIMLTRGRKSARTMRSTMPPRTTTMNGSRSDRRLATATSTSSS